MKSIADRIREARSFAKLSQSGLAAILGVHRCAITRWEGVRGVVPRLENITAIAAVTSVNLDWLSTGRGQMVDCRLAPEAPPTASQLSRQELECIRVLRSIGPGARQGLVTLIMRTGSSVRAGASDLQLLRLFGFPVARSIGAWQQPHAGSDGEAATKSNPVAAGPFA